MDWVGRIYDLQDKYPVLYKEAMQWAKIDNTRDSDSQLANKSIVQAFVWGHTTQGYSFWELVRNNHWDMARELHPELFQEEDIKIKGLTINNNGLCL